MTLPRTNPDGSVTLRSAPSGPLVTVAGVGQLPDSLELLTQQSWAIAPLTGDDAAEGTLAAPLRTGAEFTRRTYGKGLIAGETSLTILEPFPAGDDYILINSPQTSGDAFLAVRGAVPTPFAQGVITACTNAVTNTSLTTIQSDIDLSPWVGSRIRILSSATAPVGTIATILRVSGGVATLSQPYFSDTSVAGYWVNTTLRTLSVGDVFVVERPITCCPIDVRVTGISNFTQLGACGISNLDLSNSQGEESYESPFIGAQLYGCYLATQTRIKGSLLACTRDSLTQLKGDVLLYACAFIGNLVCGIGVSLYFSTRNVLWGGQFIIFGGEGRLSINNEPGANSGLSIHEWPAGAAIFLESGASQPLNIDAAVWGSSTIANTFGIEVNAGGKVLYTQSRKPTIAGSLTPTKDVEVGGVDFAWAGIPTVNASNLACIIEKTN